MRHNAPMFEGPVEVILPIGFLIILLVIYLLQKKTKPLTGQDVALKLGIIYKQGQSARLLSSFGFINRMNYGKKRHILNTFEGRYKKYDIVVFDLRYETLSIDKNGSADIYSFYVLQLPKKFPEVTIYREGFISKIKQLTGANDIDFESYEFSRKFRVRSIEPKFAYDFCNARLIEYLLENTDLSLEIDRNALCLSFNAPLKFDDIERDLKRLVAIRNLMPNYLFEE